MVESLDEPSASEPSLLRASDSFACDLLIVGLTRRASFLAAASVDAPSTSVVDELDDDDEKNAGRLLIRIDLTVLRIDEPSDDFASPPATLLAGTLVVRFNCSLTDRSYELLYGCWADDDEGCATKCGVA